MKEGYLTWDQIRIDDFSKENVAKMYEKGFVFTRIGRGEMIQTRSVRVRLSEFELSSENRRILKKTETISSKALILPFKEYDWKIGKLAKDFYEQKFGRGVMSAQKIKEMLSSKESNFNSLLIYSESKMNEAIGYAICYCSATLLHYSYPFYDLGKAPSDMGLGMMIRALEFAKNSGIEYAYLGSVQNSAGLYKLQFKGLEWFTGKFWNKDLDQLKELFEKNHVK